MQASIEYPLWPALLKASWQAGVIVVLVLTVQLSVGRRWNPRWKHALWWLVVARLALPATLASPVSIFNLLPKQVAGPRVETTAVMTTTAPVQMPVRENIGKVDVLRLGRGGISPWVWGWAAGAVLMAIVLGNNHLRIHRKVARCLPLIDTTVMNLLEDCKQGMGVRTPIALVETDAVDGPCLFGVVRPRLLLPPGFTKDFSLQELRFVFLHELAHVKRYDIPLGWLIAFLQIIHWFNPLVWLAGYRMRADRELACDALALSYAEEDDNKPYGRTIVKLLEKFGDSLRAPSLAGISEDKQQMRERISMIAKFQRNNRGAAWAGGIMFGLGLLTLTDCQSENPTGMNPAPMQEALKNYPRIAATSPRIGATDVDPSLKEITVTFGQDMGDGFSWTGDGPEYPRSPEGTKVEWRDQRTCALPVKLEAGHYYRVGVNSTTYQNFRGVNGQAALTSAVYFTTSGASQEQQARMQAPRIVAFDPPNGAQEVNTSITELRVTFNVPMGGGFSWCKRGDDFPPTSEGQEPHWSEDKKSCTLPVNLAAGTSYWIVLNTGQFKNFQSEAGVPLEPVVYEFKTSGTAPPKKESL